MIQAPGHLAATIAMGPSTSPTRADSTESHDGREGALRAAGATFSGGGGKTPPPAGSFNLDAPSDDLGPSWDGGPADDDSQRCPRCLREHAGYSARLHPCDRCRAQLDRIASWERADGSRRLELCESIGIMRRFCRGNRPPTLDDDGLRERLAARPLPAGGLLVCGTVGTHKTHLLAARTVAAAQRGLSARMVKWLMFLLEVRATYHPSAVETERDVLLRHARLDYLAIDDLGVGRDDDRETASALRLAHELLDQRYDSCLVTDISVNLTPEELRRRFDDRIARRVAELTTPYVMRLETGRNP